MKEISPGETYNKSYLAIPIRESPLFTWVQNINGHKMFYHVTLLFLGQIDDEKLSQVKQVLSLLPDMGGLPIIPDKLDFIQGAGDIFVLKVKKTEELTGLKKHIEEALYGGQFDTKYYTPHITIKRSRKAKFNTHEKEELLRIADRSSVLNPYLAKAVGLYYRTEEGATALLFSKKI